MRKLLFLMLISLSTFAQKPSNILEQLLLSNPDKFKKHKLKYIPTIILLYNGEEYHRVESGISLKLPEDTINQIEDKIDEIIESKF